MMMMMRISLFSKRALVARLLLVQAVFSIFPAVKVVGILAFTPPQQHHAIIRTQQQQRAIIGCIVSTPPPPPPTVATTTTGHYPSLRSIIVGRRASLYAASSSENDNQDDSSPPVVSSSSNSSSSSLIIADIGGILASLIVLFSEYTLKTTGCGLPAGPYGLVGAMEGISYLTVIGIAAYSIYNKLQTTTTNNNKAVVQDTMIGSSAISSRSSSIGIRSLLVQGLAFLSIIVGLAVLVFQITDYGYIPNAVPMEGGMCQ